MTKREAGAISDAEEARIQAMIARDPDAPEMNGQKCQTASHFSAAAAMCRGFHMRQDKEMAAGSNRFGVFRTLTVYRFFFIPGIDLLRWYMDVVAHVRTRAVYIIPANSF